MRKNKLGIFTISAFLVGLVISGQITSAQINQKETETAVTYTIGYLPITHALPVFEEKELLEAENSGIQIKLQKFSSWSDLTDALHAGKIDGASELIELAMSAKAKGVDLKAVALGHKDGNVIVVNNSIQSPADMKGKTFAIPSTQSSHYILLLEELQKHTFWEFGSIEEHFKYRNAVMQTYIYGNFPVFEGFNHMQYQIQNPEGFSRMLETIIETDRLPELAFAMWYRGK